MKNAYILLALAFAVLAAPTITKAETPTMCTMQYDPVCGTEKGVYKTYGNSCVLGTEGATYQHAGECTAAELDGKQEGTYTPPASCTAWFDGCNTCSSSASGQAMCTLMACVGEPAAGYCTAYGKTESKPTPPPSKPVGNESIEPVEVEVVTEATTTAETDPGFFFGIWKAVIAWFQGLF